MGKDYEMVRYIRQRMEGYDVRFTESIIRLFTKMVDYKEPNGCLSNSAMIVASARYCDCDAKLCYGLCNAGGYDIYHAWVEIDGKVFDIGIYGNSHFSPYYLADPIDKPVINCDYESAPIRYGRFVFDDDWKSADLSRAEGLSLEKYFDNSERHVLWQMVCSALDISPSKQNIDAIRNPIKGIGITPD